MTDTVFVGDLDPKSNQESVEAAMREFGPVAKCSVTPRKHFAFVKFEHAEDAASCVAKSGSITLDGRHAGFLFLPT